MALAQIIYISRSRHKMELGKIVEIAAHSESNNAKLDISGALLAVGQHFMQLLEGELSDIIQLYEKIRQDVRHTEVRCLLCKNVTKRLFPKWGMRLLDTESAAKLDLDRLNRLIEEFCIHRDTGTRSVVARVLLDDFKRQLSEAA